MSEVRLNILDTSRAIYGTIHGSVTDAAVAGLSAEPETIEELQDAVARFIKPVDDFGPFAAFAAGSSDEPSDAGIIFIDLAARLVAAESSYSMPSAEGRVQYHDGVQATDVWLPYQAPDDWLFVTSAYRFAGFGTHEVVMYYELLRFLLSECWKGMREERNVTFADEVARLGQIKTEWLERPQPDLGGRNPAYIIECERKRLPLIMSAEETTSDEDCPMCQAMREEFTPTFCHLDGCSMDNGFPFSFYLSRCEWEKEELRQKHFDDEFNRKWKQQKGKGLEDASPFPTL